ncbi:hypothetical protein ASPZODRAFT_75323 [Penicilliopsis zonata CBS 506.65]|uniref:polynucleotide adenylyltransferase n=1 Tax=Penicilliopsis zonata CBS 506.65 TaxID=1073090 RepID=A0A1L9S727_9EURO|nr:hypothetical protein ASPZODRAFT_75323 [Penicilliopsis zonata CBS 506.65]OJJ42962.1 hypothetical protein ASPZODRAFT_75323 [Penicilliopsis zonata CBS 506.65]
MPPAFEFRGNNNSRTDRRAPRPKQEFTFRYPRPGTAERPLLRKQRETTPELLLGANGSSEKPALKFAAIGDLSDSDEAEMDVSSEDEDEDSRPRKKRIVEAEKPAPAPAPRWSNPDPYTALPPPDESQSKKVDVVKMIRKARLAASASRPEDSDAVVTNEDFISFGMEDEEEDGNRAPENAPRGPRSQLQESDPALGNRKRTHDDEIKGFSKKLGKPISRFYADGSILDEWRTLTRETASPWLDSMPSSLHLGARLHNEILSFYHWVKPQFYEQIVRSDLIARLQSAFQNRYYGVQLRPFGSFASGLYLPTADIDLVMLSSNFMRNGIRTFGERKGQIYAFSAFLKNLDIAVPGSIETIAHARVPILKFVDKLTGLRVDLSFDNDSGIVANRTFQQWKEEFPAMPVVVSVIKQFLLLRGLNEVPTGGLGGFSITCLVTSLMQHLPHGRVEQNLGSLLMDFFDFYGTKFDYETVGIRMSPPGYFNKRVYKVYRENNNERLAIEDPNNPENDISGGTREIHLIFRSFANAYRVLKTQMLSTSMSATSETSILSTIIGANYEEYAAQRSRLHRVFLTDPRFAQYQTPPTPPPPPGPPPPVESAPPPPPPGPAQKDKATKMQKRQQALRDRALRLKKLRPDIASTIPKSISNEQALKLGGYQTQSEMDRDLLTREKTMQVSAST